MDNEIKEIKARYMSVNLFSRYKADEFDNAQRKLILDFVEDVENALIDLIKDVEALENE